MATEYPPVGQPPAELVEVILRAGGHHRPAEKTDISTGTGLAVAASRVVLAGGDVCVLAGWSLRETTGAGPAQVQIHDGGSAAGEVLGAIALPANNGNTTFFSGRGVRVTTGRLFLNVVVGSVAGVLYWRDDD